MPPMSRLAQTPEVVPVLNGTHPGGATCHRRTRNLAGHVAGGIVPQAYPRGARDGFASDERRENGNVEAFH